MSEDKRINMPLGGPPSKKPLGPVGGKNIPKREDTPLGRKNDDFSNDKKKDEDDLEKDFEDDLEKDFEDDLEKDLEKDLGFLGCRDHSCKIVP